jgi:ribosomal protein L37AE/L43A
MVEVGKCKLCGSNELDIKNGIYHCRKCGKIGSVNEWLKNTEKKNK